MPDISAFLTDNDLTLIGFEVDALTSCRYLEQFPDDGAMTNLMHWHQYETEKPTTFFNMYNFSGFRKSTLINSRAGDATCFQPSEQSPPTRPETRDLLLEACNMVMSLFR